MTLPRIGRNTRLRPKNPRPIQNMHLCLCSSGSLLRLQSLMEGILRRILRQLPLPLDCGANRPPH
jgi:hypothetical protein